MAWQGDAYEYSPGMIRHLLAILPDLAEVVYSHGDPATEAAAMLWDIENGLSAVLLTVKQARILQLLMAGNDTSHISVDQGISEQAVEKHIWLVEKKLKNFLNRGLGNGLSQGHE